MSLFDQRWSWKRTRTNTWHFVFICLFCFFFHTLITRTTSWVSKAHAFEFVFLNLSISQTISKDKINISYQQLCLPDTNQNDNSSKGKDRLTGVILFPHIKSEVACRPFFAKLKRPTRSLSMLCHVDVLSCSPLASYPNTKCTLWLHQQTW